MAGSGAVVLSLAAAALIVLPGPTASPLLARRRLRSADPATRRMLSAGVGIAAAALLLSVPWWAAVGSGAAAAGVVRMLPVRRSRRGSAELRDLAGLFDLLATCLDAGLPVGRSITAVLEALCAAESVGTRETAPAESRSGATNSDDTRVALAEVAALLALGADPESAWRPAAAHPLLAPLAVAARRSAVGGVRLADAIRETAADLRSRCRELADRSAARAGVAMTAPLALCFLPAFVCLGLAPVVIGLISTLHIW